MANFALLPFVLLVTLIPVIHCDNYILDVTVNCGNRLSNNPVINILTDIPLAAVAKCNGGQQPFTTNDQVHYTLPGSYFAPKSACRWFKHRGIYTYTVDVFIRYGEVGSLILTKDKIKTIVCTYNPHGKDASPSLSVKDPFVAPQELGTIVGRVLPSSQFTISIQDVRNKDVMGALNIDRQYSIFARYTGPVKGSSLKPISCDAIGRDGSRYAVLRAGCGDGVVFDKGAGFSVSGTTFRSPYFQGFRVKDSSTLTFECQVVLCPRNCDGSTCSLKCHSAPGFIVPNGRLPSCASRNHKYSCTYKCNPGYMGRGTGVTTCHADGSWTKPTLSCSPIRCGNAPNVPNSSKRSGNRVLFSRTITYTCAIGYTPYRGRSTIKCLANGRYSTTPRCIPAACTAPPKIANGVPMSKGAAYKQTVAYRCNNGYRFYTRRSTATCLINGKYSTPPTCGPKSCGKPPAITNGIALARSAVYKQRAYYRCNKGYALTGRIRSVYCYANGKYSTKPTCGRVSCGRPPVVANARPSKSIGYYYDLIKYTCNTGYVRASLHSAVRCLSNRKYSKPPSCKVGRCGKPPSIANGRALASSTLFKKRTYYRCNPGFIRSTRWSSVYCYNNGKYSRPPACGRRVYCGRAPKVSNATPSISRAYFGTTISYRCKTGYLLATKWSTTRCQANKRYTRLPACRIRSCGKPPSVTNGRPRTSSAVYRQRVYYTCNPGYLLSSRWNSVYCYSSGRYSTKPSCNKRVYCGKTPFVRNASRSRSTAYYRDTVVYRCRAGYVLATKFRTSRCQANKKYTRAPSCKLRSCGRAPSVANGRASRSSAVYNQRIYYSCNRGYRFSTSIRNVYCSSNGRYSTKPVCGRRVSCGKVPRVRFGTPSRSSGLYNDVITYRCNKGYSIKTKNNFVKCRYNTKYTSAPRCERSCGTAPRVSNAKPMAKFGFLKGRIYYRCNKGFRHALSRRYVYCSSLSKRFTSPRPRCRRVYCGRVPSVRNAIPSRSTAYYNYRIAYRCKTGYVLATKHNFAKCQANKKYTSPPVCRNRPCGKAPVVRNGRPKRSSAVYGQRIYYSCNSGYRLANKRNYVYCSSSGRYGYKPICRRVPCGKPPSVAYGKPSRSFGYYKDVIRYTCRKGYAIISRSNIVRCLSNRRYTRKPTCRRTCGKAPTIRNTKVLTKVGFSGRRLSYKCNPGYYSISNAYIYCSVTGRYSIRRPCTRKVSCGKTPRISNGYPTRTTAYFNNLVRYRCNRGYVFATKYNFARCLANRRYSSAPRCKRRPCGTPPRIANGYTRSRGTVYGYRIIYYCNKGFKRSGSAYVVCTYTGRYTRRPTCRR